ncbi:hypothetical protein DS831_04150 [Bombilactobacillus bombi]|uniref:HTH araC/xylS-type domain-containing protein n=1 Tax=Bombilactobacillus bombi TaxID=1303590 RepID=A0A3R6ZYI9_9LACO|nr:helix-turn-helix domain-containing protein [Bombilactobacillus bombi]RHW51221.1 hypothetical protein DS831_04150 [Bombilactobacillus bombi]
MQPLQHEIIYSNLGLPFKAFTFHSNDSKRTIPQHWHNHIEILFCLSGNLKLIINAKPYLLCTNNAFVINSNIIHASNSPVNNWILCIQLPYSWISTLTENQYNKNFIFQSKINNCDKITFYMKTIALIVDNSNLTIIDKINLRAQILLLIKCLVSNFSRPVKLKNIKNDDAEFANLVIRFVEEHFQENISLSTISKHFGYTSEYCSRLIKKSLGNNFKDFLNSVRLNNAYNLLTRSNKSINEISYESGFQDYRNFYNYFKKIYGVSPSIYRANNIKN